jgi:hypothetical protein
MIKTFEFKGFVKFILEQPDERKVNFSEPRSTGGCGCALIHFGKERLLLEDTIDSGYYGLYFREGYLSVESCNKEQCKLLIENAIIANVKTYGELKKLTLKIVNFPQRGRRSM